MLKDGGYAATPVLTNLDPPSHARQRRLANIAFTPKRIAALEPFIREVALRFCDERFRDGHADMISDVAWALPALVLFRVLDLPESDLARVKEGAAIAVWLFTDRRAKTTKSARRVNSHRSGSMQGP